MQNIQVDPKAFDTLQEYVDYARQCEKEWHQASNKMLTALKTDECTDDIVRESALATGKLTSAQSMLALYVMRNIKRITEAPEGK